MRVMDIPPFPHRVEIFDLEYLYRTRLTQKPDLRAEVGIALLEYMGWPNDSAAREQATAILRRWAHQSGHSVLPKRIGIIQQQWARVADIVSFHYDLRCGGHLEARGGSSVGQSIFLFCKLAQRKGTGKANLWKIWETFKDVAHLATAVIIVCADLKERPSLGVEPQQLLPLRVALLIPELVIAVALELEKYGLNYVPTVRNEPMSDPETLWRIPTDIDVVPLPPPVRKIRGRDIAVLNSRVAGNRGRANRRETTPALD